MSISKRIVSIFMILAVVFSVFSVNIFAANFSEFYRAIEYKNSRYTQPVVQKVYLQGKKTYQVSAYLNSNWVKLTCAALNDMTGKKLENIKSKMWFDVTVIEANGTKTYYHGANPTFKLAKNRTYAVYIESYLRDYKTTDYSRTYGTLPLCLRTYIQSK